MAEKSKKRGQGEGTISKRPDGTWWARITVGKDAQGKQKRKAFYGKTRKEVQEKLAAAASELSAGTYIEPSKMTLEQWLKLWLKDYKKNSVRTTTYHRYGRDITNMLIPAFGSVKLKDLRNDTLQKSINKMYEDGYKVSTIIRAMIPLRCALEQAIENEMLQKNPAQKLIFPKSDKKPERILTQDEQDRFIQTAASYLHGDLFVLILFTGLRIGEVLALTWDDIDFESGLLYVNKTFLEYTDAETKKLQRAVGPPKSKSSIREVPILPSMNELLKKIKKQQDLLKDVPGNQLSNLIFQTSKGKYLHSADVRTGLKKVCIRMDIEPIHPHTLRHTFASRCLEKGVELKVVQEILGHSSIKMTADIYTHVLPDKKKISLMKLED